MFGKIHQGSHLVLEFYVLGVFWLPIQSPYSLLFCSDFQYLHDSVLVGCMIPVIDPFLLGYPICWCVIVHAAAAQSLQSCPTLCDPMDCSLPGSSIHGIFQARILEGVAISSLVIKERNVLKLRMAPGPSSIRCILGSSWRQMIHPRPWNDWLESCRRADYPTKSFVYIDEANNIWV